VPAEISERDAWIDELDLHAAVSLVEWVLLDAPRLWIQLSLDQKQRRQQPLVPRGIRFEKGVYRTTETSIVFLQLEAKQIKKKVW
jgi:hypothetical protein